MGREIRQVPADWEHPRNNREELLPLYDESFEEAFEQWMADYENWMQGNWDLIEWGPGPDSEYAVSNAREFTEYMGRSPEPDHYRPLWKEEDRTHYQLYETVSEGTPLSPVFATLAELGEWMVATPDPVWGRRNPEAVAAFLGTGYASSMVYTPERGLEDGVTAMRHENV